MPRYGTIEGVRALIGNRDIDADDDLNPTQVDTLIEVGEAEILGAIRRGGGGGSLPYAQGSDAFKRVAFWANLFAASMVRQSHGGVAGDGDNKDGDIYMRQYEKALNELRNDTNGIIAELSDTGTDPAPRMGSHVTDLNLDSSEYEPQYTVQNGGRGEW